MSTGVSTRRLPRRKKSRLLPRQKQARRLKPAQDPARERGLPAAPAGESGAPGKRHAQPAIRLARSDRPAISPEPAVEAPRPKPQVSAKASEPHAARRAPEEEELKRKRSQLRWLEGELTRHEQHLANLRADLLPFEKRYVRRIGIRCARLDEIEAQIAEFEARHRPADAAAQQAARRARLRAQRSRAEVLRHVSPEGFDPPTPLRRLYRAVARQVHPDFGEDEEDRKVRERLMAHANRAYRRSDERRLRGILDEYEFRPEGIRGDGTPLELVRVIRKIALIRGRLAEIAEETERTRTSELSRFKARVEAAAKQGRDLLAEAAAAVSARIAMARRKLKHLSAQAAAR